ncbi:hypothetical protein OCUBac02_30800 [Bosea sp. ANAM02]|nr:hypothetical protein OCUBac02_30800 [Bosea sp. ANAM02]
MKSRSGGLTGSLRAAFLDAAFVGEEAEKGIHGRIDRAADQGGGLSLLRNETVPDQPLKVVRQGRGRDPQAFLHLIDREATMTRANQCSIELEARRITERFELLRCFFDIHGNK